LLSFKLIGASASHCEHHMTCPVAFFADLIVWSFRAGIVLLMRLTTSVALAATAFSAIILVVEHGGAIREAVMPERTILSAVINRPAPPDTDASLRVAGIN
jgi:hypothetical protein